MATLIPLNSAPQSSSRSAIGPGKSDTFAVRVVQSPEELTQVEGAWRELAERALEPNVFGEPWFFRPAWEAFHGGLPMQIVLVLRQDPRNSNGQLCGIFPLERRSKYRRLPIPSLRLWMHHQGVLATPLVHGEFARETLEAFFGWARGQVPLVDFPMIHGEGPFYQTLIDLVNEKRLLTFVDETFTRALFQRDTGADVYVTRALSTGQRKELRRQRKRLGEKGRLETKVLNPGEDAEPWIEQFLALEAAGWKGAGHTALGSTLVEKTFFESIARQAHQRGRLQMLALFLEGQPIAMKCNFLMAPGAVAFKIAYDERFAKYSPGVQLELDQISLSHQTDQIEWMDSCAIPGHSMINRLWPGRRVLQSVLISTGHSLGQLAVGFLPLLRAVRRLARG